MIDMAARQLAGASLKSAADIATGLLKLKVNAEVHEKVVELQKEIIAAQTSAMSAQADQFELVERIREFEEKIAQFETWETEKQRYRLTECISETFAYVLKRSEARGEPGHALCANCYERGKKSTLQSNIKLMLDTQAWVCPSCKFELKTRGDPLPEYSD